MSLLGFAMSSNTAVHFDAPAIAAPTATTFDTALWARITAFAFEPPETRRTFAGRLADETGWSAAHTTRVLIEYRRFLYLACRAGHPVTPSQAVDEAWHLHLMYTRHYWGVLCGEVLGQPLHHGPSLGGSSEAAKFQDWYRRTLDSYARCFGEAPPRDIWPAPEDRFTVTPKRTVDPTRCWIIPKPSLAALAPRRLRAGLFAAAVALSAPFAAIAAQAKGSHARSNAGLVLFLGVVGLFASVSIFRWLTETPEQRAARLERARRDRSNSSGCGSSGGCSSSDSSCGSGCGGGD